MALYQHYDDPGKA
jgi:hypothetical protein